MNSPFINTMEGYIALIDYFKVLCVSNTKSGLSIFLRDWNSINKTNLDDVCILWENISTKYNLIKFIHLFPTAKIDQEVIDALNSIEDNIQILPIEKTEEEIKLL